MKKCEWNYDICDTHHTTNEYCKVYVEAMHDRLHHYIRLHESRKYFDNFHSLATTKKLDEIVFQECPFCKEEEP